MRKHSSASEHGSTSRYAGIPQSKHKSNRLTPWLAAMVAGFAVAYPLTIRPWHLRWGATDSEVVSEFPGDELVPDPKIRATHAVTIRARPSDVWPWLVQMGQGRGGFYTYDWLENLMGLEIHSADRVLPEFQRLQVGDVIPLAPGGFGLPVSILEPERALVLHGDTRKPGPSPTPAMKPGDYLNASWGLYLRETDDGTTRLIERFKADYNPSPLNSIFYRLLLEPGSFLMDQGMLRGIKKRVERAATWK